MSTITAPDRSLDQRMESLQKANRHRKARKTFKAQLRLSHELGGKPTVLAACLVADCPEWAWSWRASDLLLHIPKVGRVRRDRIIRQLGIAMGKTLYGLSPRQRNALIYLLEREDTTYDGLAFPALPPEYEPRAAA